MNKAIEMLGIKIFTEEETSACTILQAKTLLKSHLNWEL